MKYYSLYLLAVIAVVFVLELVFGEPFVNAFAFHSAVALQQPWQFVTAIFLHGGMWHLALNGLALFIFGPLLEQKIGGKRFLALFLAAGIAGNALFMLLDPARSGLGASGSIFGIMGALAVLEPNMVVFVSFIPLPMWLATIFWIATEYLTWLNPLSGIGAAAHLGGLFFGLASGWWLRGKSKRLLQEYSLE